MNKPGDTIVALITGPPPAAVAVIRLSGPQAFEVASKVVRGWKSPVQPNHAYFAQYVHDDEGIVLPFESPHSFTGEDSVELSIHGGRASIQSLLKECQLAGARTAEPGEFTLRAFMAGKLGLAEAEAVAETVEAETQAALTAANRNRRKGLSKAANHLLDLVREMRSRVEATIDFPEEIGDLDWPEITASARDLQHRLNAMLEAGRTANLQRIGFRIAILGRPNAGKSSLLNAVLGRERAIVTEIPGTTRDTIEEGVEAYGVRLVFTDTAGLRETSDPVEQIGLSRSLEAAKDSALVWYVYDAQTGWTAEDEQLLTHLKREAWILGNKADLAIPSRGEAVSAATGQGIDDLLERASQMAGPSTVGFFTNDRQQAALALAKEATDELERAIEARHPPDLFCVLLGEIVWNLGLITGETVSADVLDEIFSRFCLGK